MQCTATAANKGSKNLDLCTFLAQGFRNVFLHCTTIGKAELAFKCLFLNAKNVFYKICTLHECLHPVARPWIISTDVHKVIHIDC